MRTILTIAILLGIATHSFAQKGWGVSLQPLASKAYFHDGVTPTYDGAPFFVGQMNVTEHSVTGFTMGAFVEKNLLVKNLTIRSTAGYSSIGAYQKYSYEFENSLNNIYSIEKRYDYLALDLLIKYSVPIKKLRLFIAAGPHSGFIVRATEVSTTYNYSNHSRYRRYRNTYGAEERINYGPKVDVGVGFGKFSCSAFYQQYIRPHFNHQDKRIMAIGVNLSYYIAIVES